MSAAYNNNFNIPESKLGQNHFLNGTNAAKMDPIMTQQHKQQYGGMPLISTVQHNESINKFTPPKMQTTVVANTSVNTSTNTNINTYTNSNNANINTIYINSKINANNCRGNLLGIPILVTSPNLMSVNSIPSQLRPPPLQPSLSHVSKVSSALCNGTDNAIRNFGSTVVSASENSSRASSPSLQVNCHLATLLPSKQSTDDNIRVVQSQQQQKQQQFLQPRQSQQSTISENTLINSEINMLSYKMQNLRSSQNLNGSVPGAESSAMLSMPQLTQKTQLPSVGQQTNMIQPPVVGATLQQSNSQVNQSNNFHYNFKTSALNSSYSTRTASTTTTMSTIDPTNNKSQEFSKMPTMSNVRDSQPISEVGGMNGSWPLNSSQNVNGVPVPPPPPPMQQQQFAQNQLNNNSPQQSAQLSNSTHEVYGGSLLTPTISSNQRKPLYPNPSQQLPPIIPPLEQQQQQMQQYSSTYVQEGSSILPPPQSGIFNNQANMQPLQYQNQVNQQQPQHYVPPYTTSTGSQVMQQGFNRLWGQDTIDLMQNRHILTPVTLQPPRIVLHNQFHESINCTHSIMRCTLAKIPENNNLLQKSRLPLGILIHPFRDINSLPVIQCPSIVRCRLCRTYINPFVYFVDSKMWKCNLCYRVNELPDDFQFDPATKTYGDVMRRPEVRSSTIEFIAPSEYMLRPPQPAIYLFLFDVSIIAQQSGYLENICNILVQHLDDMPGDARTQIGFIAYNSHVHFYSMAEGYNQPHEMTLVDIEDPFLPRPDNLLVNLKECKELIKDLLKQIPTRFADTHDPGSALGSALQVAYKLMQVSGGRITVFQTCLPNKGPGSLEPREDPNNRSAKDVAHLNPATDFYKRYALECSGYQIAVDLFLLNQQYSDLATISGMSKHCGGCIHHFPLYQKTKLHLVDALSNCFKRYLTRKIGFEAVMRIRCTRGLQVHTFHGNFFVRSVDLLSLPNVNPDAGYGMQISYEENLNNVKTVCFQAALLYTNSEGERRIRVHTLCLPVSTSLPEIMHAADSEAIIGLLSKMAVDRSLTCNVADAREAFINVTVDIFNSFKIAQNLPVGQTGQLISPRSLALMPLYIVALLKHPAFRVGTSTRLDDRFYGMECMKTLPMDQLMKFIYPEFYNINAIFYHSNSDINSNSNTNDDEEESDIIDVPRLQLSAEYLDIRSVFLMDCGTTILIYVGLNVPVTILENVFGIKSTSELADYVYGLPNIDSRENAALRTFIQKLNDEKPYNPIIQIIRDTSTAKSQFIEKLIDDRNESSLSYYEFLQHIRAQVK